MLVRISFAATLLVLLCSLAGPADAHSVPVDGSVVSGEPAPREAPATARAGESRGARRVGQPPASSTLDCTTRKRRATKPGSVRLAVPAGLSPVTWKSLKAAV